MRYEGLCKEISGTSIGRELWRRSMSARSLWINGKPGGHNTAPTENRQPVTGAPGSPNVVFCCLRCQNQREKGA